MLREFDVSDSFMKDMVFLFKEVNFSLDCRW